MARTAVENKVTVLFQSSDEILDKIHRELERLRDAQKRRVRDDILDFGINAAMAGYHAIDWHFYLENPSGTDKQFKEFRSAVFAEWSEFKILHDVVTKVKHIKMSVPQSQDDVLLVTKENRRLVVSESYVFSSFGNNHLQHKPTPRLDVEEVLYFGEFRADCLLSQIWFFWDQEFHKKLYA